MGDLLAPSSRVIDTGVADEPVNRVTEECERIHAASTRESEEVGRAVGST